MNQEQRNRIRSGKGFIAALDQSGGSTPKALHAYGIEESAFKNDEEMFDLVHEMRTRIIKSPSFNSDFILGAILFENTMDRSIDDQYTGDYLWNVKGIIPFLKIDQGLADTEAGVQLMKPIKGLGGLLKRANERHIFGTKMRSVIHEANEDGIKAVVKQQFEVAKDVIAAGLVPIIEPEVNIKSSDKEASEIILKEALFAELANLKDDQSVIFKLSIPSQPGFYTDVMKDPHVLRVVALSGGYPREVANELLAKNPGLIASFSRALSEGLTAQQTDDAFNTLLGDSIKEIYEASIR